MESDHEVYRFNLVRRLSDDQVAVLSCDSIYLKNTKEHFVDELSEALDAFCFGIQDKIFYATTKEAISARMESWDSDSELS